jgi:hypothetical protein
MLSSWQKSEDNNGGDSFLDGGVGRLLCSFREVSFDYLFTYLR